MKDKIKIGRIVIDDMGLLYRVVEVFKLSCVVEPLPNESHLSCEIMTFDAMEREKWTVLNVMYSEALLAELLLIHQPEK